MVRSKLDFSTDGTRSSGVFEKKKFTLIELLVVVVIIAILASLLLPALAKARFRAKLTLCIGNLKQQATAMMSYTSDSDEWYPAYQSYTPPNDYIIGDDHPWATAKHKPMWSYLGIGEDDGVPVSPYGWDHPVYKAGIMQCPQGMLEVGWANKPTASHSHPDKSYYNWYFDTWGGIDTPGQTSNMMRKLDETFRTSKANEGPPNRKQMRFNIVASDVFKKMRFGSGHSTGAPTTISSNHVYGGSRHYYNDTKGSSHFSYGPLYWGTVTGRSFSCWAFDDGRVEVVQTTIMSIGYETLKTSSATASGGWNVPLQFAVDE